MNVKLRLTGAEAFDVKGEFPGNADRVYGHV